MLRQFIQNDNGSLVEMNFGTEAEASAYVPPPDRTEVIPAKPRPSNDHRWQDGEWTLSA